MDPVKVQGVMDWLQPAKVKDVQSFIGFVNSGGSSIHNYHKFAPPFNMRAGKRKDWSWVADKRQAFDVLKSAVSFSPMLASPSKPCVGGILFWFPTRL